MNETIQPAAVAAGIRLVECPRDAMQGWPHFIDTAQKIAYLNRLLQVGFHTLDFGSFVSSRAIPQMADTAAVLEGLELGGCDTRLLAIVANQRGAVEALQHPAIGYLGFPFSVSPTFQQRNTNSTLEESMQRVEAIQELCIRHNRTLVLYLSMGFGNPYGDAYNADILLHWAGEMVRRGITVLSLADTVGLATPGQVDGVLRQLIPAYPQVEIGVHLHCTPGNWQAKLEAAFNAGCTRFDGALKGIGGCPLAQDELVGNMDTLQMMDYFRGRGILPPIHETALQQSIRLAETIFV